MVPHPLVIALDARSNVCPDGSVQIQAASDHNTEAAAGQQQQEATEAAAAAAAVRLRKIWKIWHEFA